MDAVTVGANGRRFARRRLPPDDTFAQQASMNAALVVEQRRTFRDLMPFHQACIAVAAGTSLRDVTTVNVRARVFGGQDVVMSVTIGASGRVRVTASRRLTMNAVGVGFKGGDFKGRCVREPTRQMATPTRHFLSVAWVRQLERVNIVVTIGATQLAVNGATEGTSVHKHATGTPLHIVAD
jgi:hypothetical protein